jgi:chromosome partitioning protein
MRIRRRDRSEPVQQPPLSIPEVEEPTVRPLVDSTPVPGPPLDSVVDRENAPAAPSEPSPPPFDQALLPPPAPEEFEQPPVAEAAPPPIEDYTPGAPPAPTPPTPPVELAPEPVYAEPDPAAEPVHEEPAATAPPDAFQPVEDLVVPEVEVPVEPKHARVPSSHSSAAPQMRTPSIRADADSLLDGERPAPRELPRVIAIANQKGGVGKTTTTVNLGAALAEIGYRVLVIDLDPQGNATTGLGIDARNFELSMYDVIMRDQSLEDCIEPTSVKNLFVAPATIDLAGIEIELVPAFSREMKLKRAIDTVVDDFDFILIDCPPSLGLITVNGLAAAGEVMVPIQCEYYALEGLSQLLRNVNLVSSNLNESLEVTTIVLTMFDARTRLSIEVANEVRLHFADRVCKSVIPRTVRLSEAPSFGQPITVFDPTSRGAVAYRELAKEVSNGAPQRTR